MILSVDCQLVPRLSDPVLSLRVDWKGLIGLGRFDEFGIGALHQVREPVCPVLAGEAEEYSQSVVRRLIVREFLRLMAAFWTRLALAFKAVGAVVWRPACATTSFGRPTGAFAESFRIRSTTSGRASASARSAASTAERSENSQVGFVRNRGNRCGLLGQFVDVEPGSQVVD